MLNNVIVTGPPFHFASLESGYYMITVTIPRSPTTCASAGQIPHGGAHPARYSHREIFPNNGTTITGEVMLPLINARIPLTANGKLMSAATTAR